MKRYSKAYLAKHPEKAGKDLETTRRTCAKFRGKPTAIFNFVEGTRFTQAKHRQQQSPFKHLLKPKAGGIAFVLDAMGEQLQSIINVTIHYPNGAPGFWDLLCGRVRHIVVHFEELAIPAESWAGTTTRMKPIAWPSSNGSTSCGAIRTPCSNGCDKTPTGNLPDSIYAHFLR